MLVYFAIRQTSTGFFLPGYGSRNGRRGYTHDEPVSTDTAPPRLFMKKHLAESALKWWLDGRWREDVTTSGAPWDQEPDVEMAVTKVPTRSADDMEIVAMTFTAYHMTPSGVIVNECAS